MTTTTGIRSAFYFAIVLSLSVASPAMAATAASEKGKGEFLGAKQTEHPSWFKESFLDFRDDIKDAADNDKRVILYVYQDGCPYCNRLVEYNFGQKDIYETTRKHFDLIALNMWGDREVTDLKGNTMSEKGFAKSIGVKYTPTLLFFDEQGDVVLRLNGYYPPHNFRIALDYVAGAKEKSVSYKEYYRANVKPPASGELNDEPFFMDPPYNLARNEKPGGRPLAVFFEQKQCENCDRLHSKVLTVPATRELVKKVDSVQLDMWSDTPVVTPAGKKTTAREWAKALDINFAPSIVFFDKNGKEVARTDAYLRNFHTQSLFAYVLEGAYATEPEFQRYLQHRAETLQEQGKDVDIWK